MSFRLKMLTIIYNTLKDHFECFIVAIRIFQVLIFGLKDEIIHLDNTKETSGMLMSPIFEGFEYSSPSIIAGVWEHAHVW